MVKEGCRLMDEKHLKANILQKGKLEILKQEDCTRKSYIERMTLSETRIIFQHRTRMTKSAGNYKGWCKYRNERAMCKFCDKFDSSSHLMRCDAFSHLQGRKCSCKMTATWSSISVKFFSFKRTRRRSWKRRRSRRRNRRAGARLCTGQGGCTERLPRGESSWVEVLPIWRRGETLYPIVCYEIKKYKIYLSPSLFYTEAKDKGVFNLLSKNLCSYLC